MSEFEWLDIFGDNLSDLLRERRMTQSELAEKAKLPKSLISDYVNKKKLPGIKSIINIYYALDCDLYDLIDFDEMIE